LLTCLAKLKLDDGFYVMSPSDDQIILKPLSEVDDMFRFWLPRDVAWVRKGSFVQQNIREGPKD
jgi:hypothetical protein